MNTKKARILGNSLIFIGIFFLISTMVFDDANLFVPVISILGLTLSISGFAVFFLFWKCSCCEKRLPFEGSFLMNICPYCGHNLEKNSK